MTGYLCPVEISLDAVGSGGKVGATKLEATLVKSQKRLSLVCAYAILVLLAANGMFWQIGWLTEIGWWFCAVYASWATVVLVVATFILGASVIVRRREVVARFQTDDAEQLGRLRKVRDGLVPNLRIKSVLGQAVVPGLVYLAGYPRTAAVIACVSVLGFILSNMIVLNVRKKIDALVG